MAQIDQGQARPSTQLVTGRWPSVLGVLAAGALVAAAWAGHLSWRQVTAVLVAAGLVYLGSAALGSTRAAWWLFAGTVVVIALGGRLALVDPLVALAAVAAVLLVVGIARRRLADGWGLPAQLAAMAVVLAVAFLAAAAPEPWRVILLAAGLLGHTMWDLAHLRTGRVVPRSMAEFCAVLDALLAGGVVALALT